VDDVEGGGSKEGGLDVLDPAAGTAAVVVDDDAWVGVVVALLVLLLFPPPPPSTGLPMEKAGVVSLVVAVVVVADGDVMFCWLPVE